MDRLDDLAVLAGPLLRRVDTLLGSAGAPPGHDLWAELRRVRLLPADAVHAVVALRPAALADAAPHLREQARGYADIAASLPAPDAWTGEAADTYDRGRRQLVDHLSDDPESLAGRLVAAADLGDALAHWMRHTRESLAVALADVLASAEAVTLAGPVTGSSSGHEVPGEELSAAAWVGARLLRTVADAYDRAEDLLDSSVELVDAAPVPVGAGPGRGDGATSGYRIPDAAP